MRFVRFGLLAVALVCVILAVILGSIKSSSAFTLSQTSKNLSAEWLATQHIDRIGERFNSWPVSTITSIQFWLSRVSTPTGTLYITIRNVSDDVLLGTLGSIDVSTLTTTATLYTFASNSVDITSVKDIRISGEYLNSTSTTYPRTNYQNSNVYGGGTMTWYQHNGTGWTDYATRDLAWSNLTWFTPPDNVGSVDGVLKGYDSMDAVQSADMDSVDSIQ